MKKKFVISILGSVEMTKDEIWPDGDGPEDPTEDDVHEALATWATMSETLRDWNFEEEFDWHVSEIKHDHRN